MHAFPASRQNPPPVELPAATYPNRNQRSPAGAAEQYLDVLSLPLSVMFTGRVGRPKTIEGGEEPNAAAEARNLPSLPE